MPISGNKTAGLQSLRVTVNRQNCNVSLNSLKNLIGDGFRPCERRGEAHVLAVLAFPLRSETWKHCLLQRLFHNREPVECYGNVARLGRWLRQTTGQHYSQ